MSNIIGKIYYFFKLQFLQVFLGSRWSGDRDWLLGFVTRRRLHLYCFRSSGIKAILQFFHSDQGKFYPHALAYSAIFCHHGRWNSLLYHGAGILLLKSKLIGTRDILTIVWLLVYVNRKTKERRSTGYKQSDMSFSSSMLKQNHPRGTFRSVSKLS